MSEYQYVGFRAAEKPVGGKDLEFMYEQSTRAEVTPWTFDNEYHYGDFHGDAVAMLSRGYDIHLHYANFGTRTLLIAFPNDPRRSAGAKPYFDGEGMEFIKAKRGKGGIVSIAPWHEAGDQDELSDLEELLDRLVPLRAEILAGDLRPLYLARLAVLSDSNHDRNDSIEGPVPANLNKLTAPQQALVEFFGLSDGLIAAAAEGNTEPFTPVEPDTDYADWLKDVSPATKDAWLLKVLVDPQSAARSEILAEFRSSQQSTAWPTIERRRTIAQLEEAAEEIRQKKKRKVSAHPARKRTS